METKETINVAITDDHPLMRKGIKDLINSIDAYKVTIEAAEGKELVEYIEKKSGKLPDVCVLNINTTALNGYCTLKEIKTKWPSIKVLVFSHYYDDYIILQMIRYGANGIIKKDCSPKQFVHALASVYYTDYYFSESVAKKIFEMQQHNSPLLPNITEREMEFLGYCCSELNYRDIGTLMGISVRTIESFRNSLFSKFNIKSRTGLAMFAIQNGIVPMCHLRMNV